MAVYKDKPETLNLSSSLNSMVEQWLILLKNVNKYSPHTITAYATDLFLFLQFINKYFGQSIDEQIIKNLEIKDFRSWLASRKISNHKSISNSRALSALKSFFKFLKKNYEINNDAIFAINIKRIEKPLPKALTVEKALLAIDNSTILPSQSWIGNRNKAIMMLIYGVGLRISEVLSLRFSQIPQKSDQPLIIIGKGSKEASVYILDSIIETINTYAISCPYDLSSGFLFLGLRGRVLNASTFRRELKNLVRAFNLPEHASPHAFRHSFATHLLAEGGDIRVIQELLRHESISTTQRYTKVDATSLIKSYKLFHPRVGKNSTEES